ncbi:MAG: IS66 family insertion sequence element accessory protein TnpB [Planctomycetota bacterium]
MITFSSTTQVYVAVGSTDMRKSFNGLYGIVSETLELDPTSGQLFVFCNRRRSRLKVLYWDGSGLCVLAKRLERGTFSWPQSDAKRIEMTTAELTLLLNGIDLSRAKQRDWYRLKSPLNTTRA